MIPQVPVLQKMDLQIGDRLAEATPIYGWCTVRLSQLLKRWAQHGQNSTETTLEL